MGDVSRDEFCDKCELIEECNRLKIECNALNALCKIGITEDRQRKRELIIEYAKQLDIIEYEPSKEMQELGEKVISHVQELNFIDEFEIRIGYVISYEAKKKDGRTVAADCRKVTSSYMAYLPFDFIVTFYEPNMSYMTENQKKILMIHELKHIEIGYRGLKIKPHDIEDFEIILKEYGINWNDFNKDVPDIFKLKSE